MILAIFHVFYLLDNTNEAVVNIKMFMYKDSLSYFIFCDHKILNPQSYLFTYLWSDKLIILWTLNRHEAIFVHIPGVKLTLCHQTWPNVFATLLVATFPNFKLCLVILWTKNWKLFSSILGFNLSMN